MKLPTVLPCDSAGLLCVCRGRRNEMDRWINSNVERESMIITYRRVEGEKQTGEVCK